MIYKDFQDIKLSALGLGCMRLPVVDGDDAKIDEAAAAELVACAMANGVNYYDTAWGYHSGNSELAMGRILSKYPRDKFYLATKFPGYSLDNMGKVEEIFEEQLEKCQVDYFDFYLFHNVCEMNIDAYLDPQYGIDAYLRKQKAAGRIKRLGFSAHASVPVMRRFLEAYGDHMEFCQIQLNYLDWTFQDAKAKVELLREYNIPVWVMEPVRGGRLAKLGESHTRRLNALRPDEATPAWAFRFLQGIPGVTMILSGMSNMDQLRDNLRTFEDEKPLTEQETAELINRTRAAGGRVICVGTTSCRTVESWADEDGRMEAKAGWTNIFIYPGYRFKVMDALITNFHLPESTLIMLVSALAGRERVLAAYEEAVRERYRFFSFGDAMFIAGGIGEAAI